MKKVLSLLLVFALGVTMLSGCGAEKIITEGILDENAELMEEINGFIEKINNYTPGEATEQGYTSTHFGFEFTADDQWKMYTKEELAPLAQKVKESAISGGIESIKEENLSQEMIDKLKSSIYAETEMGACCIMDGIVVGEVAIGVFSSYGIDEVKMTEYIDELVSQAESMGTNFSKGQKVIGGETYKSSKATITIESIELTNEMFVREKDGFVCMITCKSLPGYEDVVAEAFINQITAL